MVRGRAPRPIALALLLPLVAAASGPTASAPGAELIVRPEGGAVIARLRVADGSLVTLRYRNSLYGSLAEERFRVEGAVLRLVALAADERAVLDEYYLTDGPARSVPGDTRRWQATPRDELTVARLAIAATDLGERALLLRGRPPLDLWQFVEDGQPTIIIELLLPP
jgi:hypothetical protein